MTVYLDEEGEDSLYQYPHCGWCGSEELTVLGVLGNREYVRCRSCGGESSRPVREEVSR